MYAPVAKWLDNAKIFEVRKIHIYVVYSSDSGSSLTH